MQVPGYPRVEYNAANYRCYPWPNQPELKSQKDVAKYITKGKAAHSNCKNKLYTAGVIHKKANEVGKNQ